MRQDATNATQNADKGDIMENKIASWEAEMSKALNQFRKNLTGKGAKKTEVRICGNVIFGKLVIDLSLLEISLIKHIQRSPKCEADYYNECKDTYKNGINECLKKFHDDLECVSVYFTADIENNLSLITMVINMDFEQMIRKGIVELPLKGIQCALTRT